MIPTLNNLPPSAPATEWDLAQARLLAEFSRRAYLNAQCDTVPLGTISSVRIRDEQTDAEVLMEELPDAIVLAFKGTKEIRDWLTDADFFKTPIVGSLSREFPVAAGANSFIEVHRGFLAAVDSLLPKIIARLNGNSKPLIITGHSLGGAMASLAGWFLQQANFPVRAVYTFASPRVGNAAWRGAYNALLGQKTFRVACCGDLVPLIPGIFTPPCDGFRHVGREVFLEGARALTDLPRLLEVGLDGWRGYRAFKRGDIDFILQAHSITDDYIATLNQIT
ncbi:MAG TPA: lipase family protein [Verrucomicrobiae bacterium]|jgi:predicted lipase|nr:lipase family protein [Verrucomicrobiae bacterium]